jgi:hypothetical protein
MKPSQGVRPPPVTIPERVAHTVRAVWAREPWWAEFWAGVATVLWAVWPFAFGDPITARPSWFVASLLLDATSWQVGGVALGVTKIFVLLNDSPVLRPVRLVSCFIGAWFWSFLATSLMMVDPAAPSAALYIVPVLVNVYSMIRLQQSLVGRWET